MNKLDVWLDRDRVGSLTHDPATNRFGFEYTNSWKSMNHRFPISPWIPLERDPSQTDEIHSAHVRQFFENLLPEGEALDHAAGSAGVPKSNLIGLLIALGRETTGALRVTVAADDRDRHHVAGTEGADDHDDLADGLRLLTAEELSERIRERPHLPFSVWDGKVRLSIAGYQDKIAVYERDGQWFLVDGPTLASTWIVKPMPVREPLAALPAIEFTCMQLAQRVGLAVAATRLVHVPQPVLFVRRFDRIESDGRVRRLHLVDGCQALGLSVGMKYERPYGDGAEVQRIRDGASHPKLFRLLEHSPTPVHDKTALLRWAILQVLIGNTDAHAKNVSFFYGLEGLRLAPAYDLVSMPALGFDQLTDSYAMAIGDAFKQADLTPFEWAGFASDCGLPLRMVSNELRRLSLRVLDSLAGVADDVRKSGVPDSVIEAVMKTTQATCRRQLEMAPVVARVRKSNL